VAARGSNEACRLLVHHRGDENVKWKRKQHGGANANAPENGDPLQVVQ
jgi:hypothetical protein